MGEAVEIISQSIDEPDAKCVVHVEPNSRSLIVLLRSRIYRLRNNNADNRHAGEIVKGMMIDLGVD